MPRQKFISEDVLSRDRIRIKTEVMNRRFPVKVNVESSDGVDFYVVTLEDDVFAHCVCAGYQYRNHCRHLKEAYRLYNGEEK